MAKLLHHRGPDDSGIWQDKSVGLAHTRLSILDLSHAGHQPMLHPDGSVVISFNGEIYNFQTLRQELAGLGCVFIGHSDTEVLVHGYREWGEKLFDKLQGMFAIAIWDKRLQQLLLVRDRYGKKPLYYYLDGTRLVFASEIKSIVAWPEIERIPDYEAIHNYLTFQYVPAPKTAFKGVKKLMQGHLLRISLNSWKSDIESYWNMPKLREETSPHFNVDEAAESFRKHLLESVRLRMVSDVPLGAFLSGGVDSSAVVAAMARQSNNPIKTFSIGFEDDAFDETEYARLVAKQYKTEHHERIVRPNAIEMLPKLVWHYGEPFADPSAIPTFYVSELAREHVAVSLSGDGGDEGFIGYPRYAALSKCDHYPKYLELGGRLLKMTQAFLPEFAKQNRAGKIIEHFAAKYGATRAEKYEPFLVYFRDSDKTAAYGDKLKPYLQSSSLKILEEYLDDYSSPALAASWADTNTYLPDDILVKVDVASMAHSLEVRAPFLDHKMMEWAADLPVEWKYNGLETKRLVKKALEPWLPNEVLYRPKMGFGVPIENWFRNELKDMLYDTLLSQKAIERGLFNIKFVEHIINEHVNGVQMHQTRLWAMLMLELWFQMWIDNNPA